MDILLELNKDLIKLCFAGSTARQDAFNIKKYLSYINELGEKAAIFSSLESKLLSVINEDTSFSENIIESLTILNSILKIQGNIEEKDFDKEIEFSNKGSKIQSISCVKLNIVRDNLLFNPNGFGKDIIDIYNLNMHNDIRLYKAYCESISDYSTVISNYVENVIIPSIGEDIVPFIIDSIDVKGTKKDAKLFKLLYRIINEKIVPLSLKIAKEGHGILLAEALYTLDKGKEYEDILLFYAKKGKAEVRRSSFTSLIKIESSEGEDLLIKGLKKIKLGHLYEAIGCTNSSKIIKSVLDEIEYYRNNMDIKYNAKIKGLLEAITKNNNKTILSFIELIFKNKKHYKNILNVFTEKQILCNLQDQKTKEVNEFLYNISKENEDLIEFKVRMIFRLFSDNECYKICTKLIEEKKEIYSFIKDSLMEKYNFNMIIDRRWIDLLLDANVKIDLEIFLLPDDEERWTRLLDLYVEDIKNGDKYFFHNFRYTNILAKAYKIGYSNADKYYNIFIEHGYDENSLQKDLKSFNVKINI